jgi:polyisoprenoid-binding protein YceI
MKRFAFVLLSLCWAAPAVGAAEGDWNIDPAHSSVGFTVRHLGITNVHGEFHEFTATVKADLATGKVSMVEASAKTASVDTGITQRDNHLKGDDFFSAEKFPNLKVKTKTIEWSGNTCSGSAELTIRDVTKIVPYTCELIGVQKVNFGDGLQLRAGYELKAKINRKDFGLKFNGVSEGVALVGDEVKIEIAAEIFRKL